MNRTIRYEPEENPPYKLSISLGLQYAFLSGGGHCSHACDNNQRIGHGGAGTPLFCGQHLQH